MLLHEFKLSSPALLERFQRLKCREGETYTLFGNMLKSLLLYYTESRSVTDFNELIDLLVCDRIKSTLSDSTMRYILNIEHREKRGWLPLNGLVDALDVYYSTHLDNRVRTGYSTTRVTDSEKNPERENLCKLR